MKERVKNIKSLPRNCPRVPSLSYMMVMIWFCLIVEATNNFTKSFSNGLKPNRWQKFFLLSVLLFNLRWLHVRLGRPGPPPNMDANNIRYTANHCPSRKYMDAKFCLKIPPFSEQSSESSQRNLCSPQNPKVSQKTNNAKT